jgi:two-component system heavy metal sensor histidine kinase CusS
VRSFRLKIGLLSAGLSGLLLIAFAWYTDAALMRSRATRVDQELRALADPQVRRPHPDWHWQRFERNLNAIHGEGETRQFIVQVRRTDGQELWATQPWPEALAPADLPLSLDHAAESWLAGPPPLDGPMPGEPPRPRLGPKVRVRGPVYASLGSGRWRVMTLADDWIVLTLAMDMHGVNAETRRFRRGLWVALPLALALVLVGGWLVAHTALRPMELITLSSASITAKNLSGRIPAAAVDVEFRRLIDVINGMLERLERGFQQATRFSADAAHEIKTPLAILQAQLERTLQSAPDGSERQRDAAEQFDEVQRLKAILRQLLLLSQADAGCMPLSRAPLDLAALAHGAAADIQMLAPDRRVTVVAPKTLWIQGDAGLLEQAIGNLVSNAVKHGFSTGVMQLELSASSGMAALRLSNEGPIVPEQDREQIFERFHRGELSRAQGIEGSGLGLSLAREIARAHGGDLVLEPPGTGVNTFTLSLPLDHAT